jgi:TonB family protein
VLLALVLGVILVALTARRTAIDVLFHRIEPPPVDSTAADTTASGPQSIIAFRFDPESDSTGVIDVTPPPPPPPPPPRADTTRVRPEHPEPGARPDLDVDDLLEQDAGARSGTAATGIGSVPPRPVEITWPETRRLKQCIGQSVSVRILVSEKGAVKDAVVVARGVLPECADAALVAARHIRFEPGRTGGVASEMWTEVRIDFQRRD